MRRLGELIGSGVLVQGERLPTETELAQLFGVSPMTIRNALKVMRDYELVETRRGRGAGTFVRQDVSSKLRHPGNELPSLEEFLDFTVWREAISGEACAIAAREITPALVDELNELVAAVDAPGLSPEDYRFADARLHLRIAEMSGSQRLLEGERQIQDYLSRSLHETGPAPDSTRLDSHGHDLMVHSITSGDPDAARQRLHEHARATIDLMVGIGYLKSAG